VLTFENLIAHNKRLSTLLAILMLLVLALMCGLVVMLFKEGFYWSWSTFALGARYGVVFASAATLLSYFLGGKIVALISDARKIEYFQDRVLFNIVEEMAIAAGIPTPDIYVIFDDALNAFASGRGPDHALVGITTGLRKTLSRDELQAVIAHEIAHIKNYDTRLMMITGVYAGLIVLLADLFRRRFLDCLGLNLRGKGKGPAAPTSFAKATCYGGGVLLFAWAAPSIAKILQLAVAREREYLADATAVQLCRNPTALSSALRKIALDSTPLTCDNRATEHMFIVNPSPERKLINVNRDSIWSTHPPLIKRISRIRRLIGEYESKQENTEEGVHI